MRRPGMFLSWLVIVCLLGGHWFALQTVAWTSMIVDFSTEMPVTAAVAKTFSGEAPCALCHAVADGIDPTTPAPTPLPTKRIAMLLQCDAIVSAPVIDLPRTITTQSWVIVDAVVPEPRVVSPLQRPPIG